MPLALGRWGMSEHDIVVFPSCSLPPGAPTRGVSDATTLAGRNVLHVVGDTKVPCGDSSVSWWARFHFGCSTQAHAESPTCHVTA